MLTNNPLNSLSYTNKDFQEIFPEQLDLVKKLTYKWDPSQSNESDPGVLLLKANAAIADKNNYQIDKSILELSPETVTHDANARKLFEQLGYTMNWYIAGTGTINLKWIGAAEDNLFISPFMSISDESNSVVYTILGPAIDTDLLTQVNYNPSNHISRTVLPTDGQIIELAIIEGVLNDYKMFDSTRITFDKLDNKNRLYFSSPNVAQNGIFIENADTRDPNIGKGNFSEWSRVDNLNINYENAKVYKFGYDSNLNMCYIEFSDNIAELIGSGLYIKYITSKGTLGNVIARQLEQFYGNPAGVRITDSTTQVALNTSNILVRNLNAITTCCDPETISDAYRNYKKTVGTFDTLVSLRDYNNAIQKSKLVSNCVVSDRTNDIQSSYKVISQISNNISASKTKVIKDSESQIPYMSAFDLKLYPLTYVADTSTYENYEKSFQLDLNDSLKNLITGYINDNKSLQHNFIPLITAIETSKPNWAGCLFINEYPIKCKIIPQYELTTLQQQEVINNVKKELYSKLSSKNIEFGSEASYDDIYDIIMLSDNRIKNIFLEDLDYTTYFLQNVDTSSNTHSNIRRIENKKIPLLNTSSSDDLSNLSREAQLNILARSILAGITQLFDKDNDFKITLNQSNVNYNKDIAKIKTSTKLYVPILFKRYESSARDKIEIKNADAKAESEFTTIRSNETLVFNSTNLKTIATYSTYVRYLYKIHNTEIGSIQPEESYELGNDDYIVLFSRTSDDVPYNFTKYGAGTIIKTNFSLNYGTNDTKEIGKNLELGKGTLLNMSDSDYISNSDSDADSSLGTTKKIEIQKFEKNNFVEGKNYFYWHLNNKNSNGKHQLFTNYDDIGDTKYATYTLGPGEYFAYATSDKLNLTVLGQGTEISMSYKSIEPLNLDIFAADPKSLSAFNTNSLDKINTNDMICIDNSKYNITTSAKRFVYLTENTDIKVTYNAKVLDPNATFDYTKILFTDDEVYLCNDDSGEALIEDTDYTLSDFIISTKAHGSTDGFSEPFSNITLTNSSSENLDWKTQLRLSLAISNEIPQVLYTDQIIYYTDSNDIDGTINIDSNNDDSPIYVLSNRILIHTGEQEQDVTWTDLNDNIYYLNLYAYKIKNKDAEETLNISENNDISSLKFKIGRNTSEVFAYGIPDNDNPAQIEFTISDSISFDEDSPCAVESFLNSIFLECNNDPINRWFKIKDNIFYFKDIDIGTVGLSDENNLRITLRNNSFLSYFKLKENGEFLESYTLYYNTPGTINIEGELIKGNYLLPLIIDSENIENIDIKVQYNNEADDNGDAIEYAVQSICGEQEFSKQKTYYLYLNVPSSDDKNTEGTPYKLTFNLYDSSYTDNSANTVGNQIRVINIRDLFKYNINNSKFDIASIEIDIESLLQKINDIDQDSIFDYTTQVNLVDNISNPLLAKTFNDSLHVMNRYTISKIGNIDIMISNRTR